MLAGWLRSGCFLPLSPFQWWWHPEYFSSVVFFFIIIILRYESSTLILYKELSSTIFPLWVSLSGIGNTCPDLHFLQYIKAWMSSTDPVSSITNCYRLIVSYTDPIHSVIISWRRDEPTVSSSPCTQFFGCFQNDTKDIKISWMRWRFGCLSDHPIFSFSSPSSHSCLIPVIPSRTMFVVIPSDS